MPASTLAGTGRWIGSPWVATTINRWRESSLVVKAPLSSVAPDASPSTGAGPCSSPTTAIVVAPERMIGPRVLSSIHGEAVPRAVPGRTRHRNSTVPEMPSMRRASSAHGRRPAMPVTRASVMDARPCSVVNVVRSTFVLAT